MLGAICLEVLHRLSHLSMNVSGEFCVYEDPHEQLSRGVNCMTPGVGIKYVEHICTEVAPRSVLQKRNAFSLQVCLSHLVFVSRVFGAHPDSSVNGSSCAVKASAVI